MEGNTHKCLLILEKLAAVLTTSSPITHTHTHTFLPLPKKGVMGAGFVSVVCLLIQSKIKLVCVGVALTFIG